MNELAGSNCHGEADLRSESVRFAAPPINSSTEGFAGSMAAYSRSKKYVSQSSRAISMVAVLVAKGAALLNRKTCGCGRINSN